MKLKVLEVVRVGLMVYGLYSLIQLGKGYITKNNIEEEIENA